MKTVGFTYASGFVSLETRLPEFVLWWRQENVGQERISHSSSVKAWRTIIFTCAGMEIPRGIQTLLSNGGMTRGNHLRGETHYFVLQ